MPGFEIPSRYFRYVRTGDARPLEGVLEHNRLDLLSLALLTARAAQLVEEGPPACAHGARSVGLGRLYQLAGRVADARRCFGLARGIETARPACRSQLRGDGAELRAEALSSYAACHVARVSSTAAAAWSCLLTPPGVSARDRSRSGRGACRPPRAPAADPLSARGFALQSLQLPLTASRREALHHRVARLSAARVGAHGDDGALVQLICDAPAAFAARSSSISTERCSIGTRVRALVAINGRGFAGVLIASEQEEYGVEPPSNAIARRSGPRRGLFAGTVAQFDLPAVWPTRCGAIFAPVSRRLLLSPDALQTLAALRGAASSSG